MGTKNKGRKASVCNSTPRQYKPRKTELDKPNIRAIQ